MKRIIVYPFSNEVVNLIKVLKEDKNKEIVLSIPRGWYYVDESFCFFVAADYTWGEPIGCKITNQFEEELKSVDEVVILDVSKRTQIYDDYINNIIASLKAKKKVRCFAKLKRHDAELVSKLANESNTELQINFSAVPICDEENEKMYTIETPVVGIGNLVGSNNINDVVSLIANSLRKRGYRPAIISTNNNLSAIKGIYSCILEKTDRYSAKSILKINNMLRDIEQKEKIDIFLVDIPGAMMKYSNGIFGDFSLAAYCYSQALEFDYFILNSIVGNYDSDFYNSISECFEKKFGAGIDTVFIENRIIDMNDSLERHDTVFNKVPCTYVDQYLNSISQNTIGIQFKNGSLSEEIEHVVEKIIDCLSNDVEIV